MFFNVGKCWKCWEMRNVGKWRGVLEIMCCYQQTNVKAFKQIRLTELFRPHIGLWVLYIYEIDTISANPHNLSIIHTKRKLGVDPKSEKMIVKINTQSTFLMKPWYDRTPLGYILVVELSRKHAKYEWFHQNTQLLQI